MQLELTFHHYWRVGTGRAAGAVLDELVHTDGDGLPVIPGKMLKGVLRDAVYKAEQWKWKPDDTDFVVPAGTVDDWFGGHAVDMQTVDDPEIESETRLETIAGALRVSSAEPEQGIRDYLRYLHSQGQSHKADQLRQALFHTLQTTAVDPATGSAKAQSLRSMQVTVPMILTAQVNCIRPPLDTKWTETLERCLPLIRAIGANTSRGLGRVSVEVKQNAA